MKGVRLLFVHIVDHCLWPATDHAPFPRPSPRPSAQRSVVRLKIGNDLYWTMAKHKRGWVRGSCLCVCIECRILFKSFVLLQFSLQDKGGKIFLFVCLAHLPLSICLVSSSSWPVLSRLLLVASSTASSSPLSPFPLSPWAACPCNVVVFSVSS